MPGINDGLGWEEGNQAGSQVASLWLAGSVVSQDMVSGLNVFATGSIQSPKSTFSHVSVNTGSMDVDFTYSNAGSPYYNGDVLQFSAETIITGGMWVTVSGAAGGASVKAKAAAASTTPLGVAVATVASGATVNILCRGPVYLIADATVANGEQIRMGAGAALNTVASATAGTGARGVALAGAGSESLALVYLW